jgi:hypothetical protein
VVHALVGLDNPLEVPRPAAVSPGKLDFRAGYAVTTDDGTRLTVPCKVVYLEWEAVKISLSKLLAYFTGICCTRERISVSCRGCSRCTLSRCADRGAYSKGLGEEAD